MDDFSSCHVGKESGSICQKAGVGFFRQPALVKVKRPSPSSKGPNGLITRWLVPCVLGTAWMGQEWVLSWACGGESLPPASLSMRPADLFIVASDGFHKPNGTDTPLMT